MEVGGDFCKDDIVYKEDCNSDFFKIGKKNKFLMSGRTAIDTALQDILEQKNIKNVFFPSYSCESMKQPFIDRNINICYYNVFFDDGLKYNIDTEFDCDIFFAMNYFGYTSTNMEKYIRKFKDRNVIVIEDITHSLFSVKQYSNHSDYIVASLRKWAPINCGGFVAKLNDEFIINFDDFDFNKKVIDNKKKAMQMKLDSIKNNRINQEKDNFLSLYKISNNAIKDDYKSKLIDNDSLKYLLNFNIQDMIKKRKENVKAIYDNLDKKAYKLLIKDYNEQNDCLLYVPIYMEKNKLNQLKKVIYEGRFYCPSHWPIDSNINDLFEYELSLVCDQRYSKNQIIEKMNLMNKYLGEM